MERLNKALARAGVASRRGADRLIVEGRVTVNGRIVTELGTRVEASRDAIKVDGRRIAATRREPVYLVLHKPRGVVTTFSDPEGRPTVRGLLKGVRQRVFAVGRLDYDSEGLLLITDDGELARDLMHPARQVPRRYRVKVRGQPSAETLERLRRGIVLDGRRARAGSARCVQRGASHSWVELTLGEGRKHQVKRMLAALGHPVLRLRRVAYGGVELGALPAGGLRPLRAAEVARLRKAAAGVID